VLVRLLRWLLELCFFELLLLPELSFSLAKATPPVNNDSARRLERMIFMPYQCVARKENRNLPVYNR
jgi:hypothetical protein